MEGRNHSTGLLLFTTMMSVSLLHLSMTLPVSSDTSVVQAIFDVAPIMRELADRMPGTVQQTRRQPRKCLASHSSRMRKQCLSPQIWVHLEKCSIQQSNNLNAHRHRVLRPDNTMLHPISQFLFLHGLPIHVTVNLDFAPLKSSVL